MKPSRDVCPLRSLRPSRVVLSACWNCLHEIGVRPRLRSYGRASRLDPASHRWEPSYLRQDGEHRPAFDSYSRQSGIEKRFVAAPGEACRHFRRGHVNMHVFTMRKANAREKARFGKRFEEG